MESKIKALNSQGISVVIPCFNSELTLDKLLNQITSEFKVSKIRNYEVILVLDSPDDNTLQVAINQQKTNHNIVVVELNKNFGQHAAIFAGLSQASYNFIVTMDDDGQHPVNRILDLVSPLCDDFDVVYGVANKKEHGFLRNMLSKLVKFLIFKSMKIDNARNLSAFRAFKRTAIEGIEFRDLTSAIVDVVLNWNTSKFHSIKVDMSKRSIGKSNYNSFKLIKFAIQMITGYSIRPLRIATFAGLLTFFASFIALISLIIQALNGKIVVAGYASISLFILFLGAIQLLTLGLIGEYLGKVHEKSMGKPLYSIKSITKS
jgi:glycosyltransferase involved in cell wall biosynthesis